MIYALAPGSRVMLSKSGLAPGTCVAPKSEPDKEIKSFCKTWNKILAGLREKGKQVTGGVEFVTLYGDPNILLAEVQKAGKQFPVTVTVYRNGIKMDNHDHSLKEMKIVNKKDESVGPGKLLAEANWNEFTGKLDAIGKRDKGGVEFVSFKGDPDKLLAEIKKYSKDFPVTVHVFDYGISIDCHDELPEMVIIDKR